MAYWTLLHMRSPLNTSSGTGQYGELTRATSRSLSFATVEGSTLSFSMPGNHRETALIVPRESDILVFRDEVPIQRYRVISRQLSKSSGVLTAQFAAISYKQMMDTWVVHPSDTRSWTTPTEQTAMAWTVLSEGQARTRGTVSMTRGTTPTTPVNRVRGPITDSSSGESKPYLDVGKKRGEFVKDLSDNISGFEWDIEPDPANAYTALKFNSWNEGARGSTSDLILDDGGSMASWTHSLSSETYLNVLYLQGNSGATGAAASGVWYPTTQDPSGTPPEGRWERVLSDTDVGTDEGLTEKAPEMYRQAHDLVPAIACTLRSGAWKGKDQLWIGDDARLIISEPVMDAPPDEWIVYIDEAVRVTGMNVTVDDLGAETVSLSLVRPGYFPGREVKAINDRLTKLERR